MSDMMVDMENDNVADMVVINVGHTAWAPEGHDRRRVQGGGVRWFQAGGLEVGAQRASRILVQYIVNIKDWDCFDGGRIVSNCLQLSRSKEDQREGWPPLRSPRKEKVFRTAFHLNVLSEDNRKVLLIQKKDLKMSILASFSLAFFFEQINDCRLKYYKKCSDF